MPLMMVVMLQLIEYTAADSEPEREKQGSLH